ncbi:hypothetical protein Leryth_022027 [Lithospermum erythrorhizon]|nr:hypothetical protein Leryth_022027 [Lithospermum erythrorhizon]
MLYFCLLLQFSHSLSGLATTSDNTKLEDDIPEEDDEGLRREGSMGLVKFPGHKNLQSTTSFMRQLILSTRAQLPHQSAKLCLADGIIFNDKRINDKRTSLPYKWT